MSYRKEIGRRLIAASEALYWPIEMNNPVECGLGNEPCLFYNIESDNYWIAKGVEWEKGDPTHWRPIGRPGQ